MSEAAKSRRQNLVRMEAPVDETGNHSEETRSWRPTFLEALAQRSSVAEAAAIAEISEGAVYRLRRNDASFARDWRAAVLEGYEHLELETLHRLRMGTGKDDPKFDIANALRLIAVHKETLTQEQSGKGERDEEAIIASLDAKLARIRAREENVTRMLHEEGVSAPRLSSADD